MAQHPPCGMQPVLEDIVSIWAVVAKGAAAFLHGRPRKKRT